MTKAQQEVVFSSDKMEWETPPEVFDFLDRQYHFTLDVCATEDNAKCPQYFSPEHDALAQSWTGTCWMNPPYGRIAAKWIQKAYEEGQRGATVVALIASQTDTEWWHRYVMRAAAIFLVKRRIKFIGANDDAPFPSAVVEFRKRDWFVLGTIDFLERAWYATEVLVPHPFLCRPAAVNMKAYPEFFQ